MTTCPSCARDFLQGNICSMCGDISWMYEPKANTPDQALAWCREEYAVVKFLPGQMHGEFRVRVQLNWWHGYFVERDDFLTAVQAAIEETKRRRERHTKPVDKTTIALLLGK